MQRRSWKPFAAPAAFLVVVTVVVLVVHGGLRDHSPATSTVTTTPASAVTHTAFYTVRPGDTFTSIAGKTGVTQNRLSALNPKIDPTQLFIGEKIRLR